MKIDKPSNTQLASFVNPYQKLHSKPYLEKTANAKRKDQVHISDQAKAMLQNQSTSETVRQEKVQQLKEQVQNGEYKVDSRKVAEKMYQVWFE